jgi:Transposase DDE domain
MGHGLHGDIRLVRRGARILDDIVRSGSVVVRKMSGGRAGEIAAHRFLGSPDVTPEAIVSDFSRRTAQACRDRFIVAAQDTTEINFSGADRHRPGLGLAGDGKSLGFFIHPVVAIDAADEAVLGVAGARIWTRGMDRATDRQKRRLEDKESERWLEGAQTAATVLAPAARVVVVGDRESDIYQIFTRKPANIDLIVRARGDRKLADGGLLFETGAALTPAVTMDVKVAPRQPRAPGDSGRIARVAVSFGQATIVKPKTGRPSPDARQVTLNLVVAREIDEPFGSLPRGSGPPLLWRLLTTMPVETIGDALETIRLYRLRWRIEQVFRVLKRDGLALEKTQVEQASSLFNLAALALGAAARIIQLTDARDASARPAADVIDASLIEAADAIGKTLEGKTERQKNPHSRGSLSWLAWITARLGGWNCYYKPPGPKTMADGWRRLADMLGGYAIAQRKSSV